MKKSINNIFEVHNIHILRILLKKEFYKIHYFYELKLKPEIQWKNSMFRQRKLRLQFRVDVEILS